MKKATNLRSFIDRFPKLSIKFRARLFQPRNEPDAFFFFSVFVPRLKIKFTGYDFGANFGVYSYYMKDYCHHVHSIEPNPIAYSFLRSWTKGISNITSYENAVSEEGEALELMTPIINGVYRHRLSSTERWFIENRVNLSDIDSSIVQPLNLNEIGFSSNDQYTLFKCDIEGGEVAIKSSLRSALKNKSLGMIEMSPKNTRNFEEFLHSFHDCSEIYVLKENDFLLVSESNLEKIAQEHFNYFFFSKSILSENESIIEEIHRCDM